MALSKEVKQTLINEYGKNEKDSGNICVQIAIITEEINRLTKHLQSTKKDLHSKAGIYKKSSARYRMLLYLKSNDIKAYTNLIKKLKIRDIK